MKVYKDIKNVPFFKQRAITIGNFDGIHLGHISILDKLLEDSNNLRTMVLTFDPPPRFFFNKNDKLGLLTTIEEKIDIFEKIGIDELFIIPFNNKFSNLSSIDFINNYLYKQIGFKKFFIGFNNYFGKNKTGSYELLKNLNIPDIEIIRCNPILSNDTIISSSIIRNLISEGNIEQANIMLGRPYSIQGKIISGNKIGRKIGFPTINIHLENTNKLLPKNAVYACEISLNNKFETLENLTGMVNIGLRPTIENNNIINIEANIFNFKKDVYNYSATIFLKKIIREERKFNNIEELIEQIKKDKIVCTNFFQDTIQNYE
ncbi:MAG: bifunctional riboflavin kinase/FAD synthetase [Bacteroidetes bacterium]|nr:bifunctional riboflavin kinase/FAD synthetase [Bacteroidota bacterium]